MSTATVKAFACHGKDKPFEKFSYEPRPLGPADVEIEIDFCGICGSDIHTIDSGWGPANYPVVVGHEIIGKVIAKGSDVDQLSLGDRVGVGALVWACKNCDRCAAGHDNYCTKKVFTYNHAYADGAKSYGGYASHVRVQQDWAFRIPEGLPSDVAAPLLCAGVTVYAPLKRAIAGRTGLKIGVAGIGGLGHLAVQFAAKMGNKVVAISHSPSKKAEAEQLGAVDFCILSDKNDYDRIVDTLDILLISSFYAHESMDNLMSLLAPYGQALIVALPEDPLSVKAVSFTRAARSLSGSLVGSVEEVKDMLEFAAKHDVKPWIQKMPMENVNEAIKVVRDGKPRYRVVLEKTPSTFV